MLENGTWQEECADGMSHHSLTHRDNPEMTSKMLVFASVWAIFGCVERTELFVLSTDSSAQVSPTAACFFSK